jgi:molecular chaperone GrpE
VTSRAEEPVAQGSGESVEERVEPSGSPLISGEGPPASDQAAAANAAEAEAEPADEMERLRQERDSHLEDLKRLKAEFENYRKRILKEQTEFAERASAGVVAALLGVLDNFDLAVAAAEETHDFEKMLRGVEMVYGELKEVLGGEGLRPIDAKGKPFDPNLHEAALEVPGSEDGELVVAEVLRPGYMLKGKVLRPAMVKVTRR